MNVKVEAIVQDLVRTVSSWDCVDSILLGESAEEAVNDPYFFISLDVYYHGVLPNPESRSNQFSGCGAFEFSLYQAKDRFLVQDMPVRLEYKDISRIDNALKADDELIQTFRETGTYMFYRIVNGKIMMKRSDWIDGIRNRIQNIPDSFWNLLSQTLLRRTEHFLSDIGSAVINNDPYFYLVSISGFVRNVCSYLFAVNRRFEPSDRFMNHRVEALPVLPANFRGHFGSIIRVEKGLPPQKIHEVAVLLTRELIALEG